MFCTTCELTGLYEVLSKETLQQLTLWRVTIHGGTCATALQSAWPLQLHTCVVVSELVAGDATAAYQSHAA
jgi:hypothetical protein